MSGALAISCSTPLTVSLMLPPLRRARAASTTASSGDTRRGDARRRPDRRPSGRPRRCGSARPLRRAHGRRADARDADAQSARRLEQIATFATENECACRRRSVSRRPGAVRRVELDLEHEPPAPVAGEEVLDRLRALAALAGRSGRARRARSAARRDRRAAHRRPADAHRLPPTVACGAPRGRRSPRANRASSSSGAVHERGDRDHRADPDDVAVDAQLVEPAAVEQQRARGLEPARRDLRHQDRAAGEDRDVLAVSEELDAASSAESERAPRPPYARFYSLSRPARVKRRAEDHATLPRAVRLDRRARVGAHRERRISPTAGSRPRSTSRSKLEKPLLSKARRASGRPRRRRRSRAALGARLIRLQCYEGLDVAHAVYEWNYARQLLHIRAAQEGTVDEAELFGPEFLIRRPLLEAVEADRAASLLLIDEIDRADEEFEAFLLEVLSDFQITVPELGTIEASSGRT